MVHMHPLQTYLTKVLGLQKLILSNSDQGEGVALLGNDLNDEISREEHSKQEDANKTHLIAGLSESSEVTILFVDDHLSLESNEMASRLISALQLGADRFSASWVTPHDFGQWDLKSWPKYLIIFAWSGTLKPKAFQNIYRKPYKVGATTVLWTHSLAEMLDKPELKKSVWSELQGLMKLWK
jgi:hypothetical protein